MARVPSRSNRLSYSSRTGRGRIRGGLTGSRTQARGGHIRRRPSRPRGGTGVPSLRVRVASRARWQDPPKNAAKTLTVGGRDRAGTSGPTEIWLPAADFPGVPKVASTDPAGTWRSRWDAGRRVLSVWAAPGTPEHTVTVRP
jgi:hypothetical protein